MNSLALNQTRVSYAYGADYVGAEEMLGQITGIRNEAENRIRQALKEKHQREVCRTFFNKLSNNLSFIPSAIHKGYPQQSINLGR